MFSATKGHPISQLFTPVLSGGWEVDLLWENSCTTPDPQSPPTALLLRSRNTIFPFFFLISNQIYQATALYSCFLHLFFISTPFFIFVCFAWDLLLASHLLNTSHFADALVNLFYFHSKSLLKVLGIISK